MSTSPVILPDYISFQATPEAEQSAFLEAHAGIGDEVSEDRACIPWAYLVSRTMGVEFLQ